VRDAYRAALLDWMACAIRGARERAAMAVRQPREGRLERTASLGTAGHALDFDDTYLPGIAHLSAPTAPAALVVGAARGSSVGEVLAAYAEGFEAMGALSRASHPGLYERGWHPTAVCGSVGAAVAASRLLKLDEKRTAGARRLALLRAGGTRAAFGSDGKALQVGLAASVGVHAALAAQGGVAVGDEVARGPHGFSEAFGGTWADPDPAQPAIAANWIKPWPCCLLAHAPLEAALALDASPAVALEVVVHPVARAAARYDDVADGLQAKFSIPYLVAFARLRGEPGVESFAGVDDEVRAHAREKVTVRTDAGLGESEALLLADGETVAHVRASRGSPERPLSAAQLAAKVRSLAGERLDGLLDDPGRPAADLVAAVAG
jgi:2-methylcitrate dehydratase PrpD